MRTYAWAGPIALFSLLAILTLRLQTEADFSDEPSTSQVSDVLGLPKASSIIRKVPSWPQASVRDQQVQGDFREELLFEASFRYPHLIRRLYTGNLEEIYVADHFLIQLDANQRLLAADLPPSLQNEGLGIELLFDHTYRLRLPVKSLAHRLAIETALAQHDGVLSVHRDTLQYTHSQPSDPYFSYLWAFANSGKNPFANSKSYLSGKDAQVAAAWQLNRDCSGIPIAILDTGVDYNHPDLAANILRAEGRSFVSGVDDFLDDNGHGTHVAGTVGAVGNNGIGVSGVCWQARIIPIKVMDAQGIGITSEIIKGIAYAATTSARIANMSIGSGSPIPLHEEAQDFPYLLAIKEFERRGKLMIATSGNSATDLDRFDYYPATLESEALITVGALTPQGLRANFSGFGQAVDIAAPGVDILSTWPSNLTPDNATRFREGKTPIAGYGILSGTSMAAPLVSGIVALMWQQLPQLSGLEIRRLLLDKSPRSTIELFSQANRYIDAASLLKGAAFHFEALPSSREARAGASFSFQLSYAPENFYSAGSVEVLYRGRVLAQAKGAVSSINFSLPADPQAFLIVRVRDSLGRIVDAAPYFISLGQTIPGLLNLAQLQGVSGGVPNCSLALVLEDAPPIELHSFQAPSSRLCRKFCDAALPLMPQDAYSFVCGEKP